MSCFYFCFFLLIFVFKVLGYPYGILLAKIGLAEVWFKKECGHLS